MIGDQQPHPYYHLHTIKILLGGLIILKKGLAIDIATFEHSYTTYCLRIRAPTGI